MKEFLEMKQVKIILADHCKGADFTDCKTEADFITQFSKIQNEMIKFNMCRAFLKFCIIQKLTHEISLILT